MLIMNVWFMVSKDVWLLMKMSKNQAAWPEFVCKSKYKNKLHVYQHFLIQSVKSYFIYFTHLSETERRPGRILFSLGITIKNKNHKP